MHQFHERAVGQMSDCQSEMDVAAQRRLCLALSSPGLVPCINLTHSCCEKPTPYESEPVGQLALQSGLQEDLLFC